MLEIRSIMNVGVVAVLVLAGCPGGGTSSKLSQPEAGIVGTLAGLAVAQRQSLEGKLGRYGGTFAEIETASAAFAGMTPGGPDVYDGYRFSFLRAPGGAEADLKREFFLLAEPAVAGAGERRFIVAAPGGVFVQAAVGPTPTAYPAAPATEGWGATGY